MNHGQLGGHLGAEPEVRFTSSGQKVITLRLGANSRGKETIWWRITLWGDQFDKMLPYLKKGSGVIVMGEIHKPETYTDKEGHPQVSMNITAYHLAFSPFGRSGDRPQDGSQPKAQMATAGAAQPQGNMMNDTPHFSEDEIPF